MFNNPARRGNIAQRGHVLILGDTHFPFAHRPTINKFLRYVKAAQPTHVVQMGDLYDFYSYGRFPGPRLMTPQEELRKGRRMGEQFWSAVHDVAPRAHKVQLVGNHDIRPLKQLERKYPELLEMFDLSPVLTFDGVETWWDVKDFARQSPYWIGDVAYFHGYASGRGRHSSFMHANVVTGHTHKGHFTPHALMGNRSYWELNVGLAGDPRLRSFGYTPNKVTGWTLGFGEVHEMGGAFYLTDSVDI